MDRLTLPKIVHKVKLEKEPSCVRHGSVPGGDSLPAWERLPLDAKFPMIPAPKGSVVLATTELCKSKHCTNKDHDFDLTDPCAHFMSNVYRPLHDPHLKAHFNSQYMRRHLIRNTFITGHTKVICTLREFNEYRQYLRKICLLELAREQRQKEERGRFQDDFSEKSEGSAKELEIRRKLREQKEKEKERLMLTQAAEEKRLEKRKRDLEAQHLERETRGRQEEDRRRHLLVRLQEQENERILGLVKRWVRDDEIRNERLETMKNQQMLDTQQKLVSKWEERRRIQEERLACEAEKREKLNREKRQSIEHREKMVLLQRQKQEEFLRKLRNRSVKERASEQAKYDRRISEKLASGDYPLWTPQGRRTGRRHRFQTPFQSMWVLEKVLRTLSIPDIYASSSPTERASKQKLLEMLNDAIDEAVDLVSSSTDRSEVCDSPDSAEGRLRDTAQAVVRCTIEKVTKDVYPAYLKYLEEEGGIDLNKFVEEYGVTEGEDDSDSDYMDDRAVRFNSKKEVIPSALLQTPSKGNSEAPSVSSVALKPVSAHQLTPMPSDLAFPGSSLKVMIHSVQRIHIDLPEEETVDKEVVISALNVLLDDVTEGRCSREELEILAEYAVDIVHSEQSEHASTSTVANDLVESILKVVLNDIQSGKLSDDELTKLTMSVVGKDTVSRIDQAKSESDPVLLDNFIAATLKKILDELDQESWSKETVRNLAIAISSNFVESSAHSSAVVNKMVSETLRHLVSSVTQQDSSCPTTESSTLAKGIVSEVLVRLADILAMEMKGVTEPSIASIANMVVGGALKQLANHMSLSQSSQHDVGSSLLAERIVAETLSHLAMHGPFRVCFPSDAYIDGSISRIALVIVEDTLKQLERQTQTSDITVDQERDRDGDSSTIASRIVSGMLRQLVQQRSLDGSRTSSISNWVVGNTLKQLAGIISSTRTSVHVLDEIDEEHYRLAREIVSATLKELGKAISSCHDAIYQDSSSFIADSLVSETLKQLTRTGQFSTMSTIKEGEPINSSMLAKKIVTETLNELTKGQQLSTTFCSKDCQQIGSSVLANRTVNDTLKQLETSADNHDSLTDMCSLASKVVPEILRQLTEAVSLNDSQYSSMVASRIVSETLAQLAMARSEDYEDNHRSSDIASRIVNETLKYLQDMTVSHSVEAESHTTGVLLTPCMAHKIVIDTLVRLVEAVSISAVEVESEECVEHDLSLMARQIVQDTFAQLENSLSVDKSAQHEDPREDSDTPALASQIVHETLKQITSALSVSSSVILIENKEDNLHVANTIIRNTLDKLASVMSCSAMQGLDGEPDSYMVANQVVSNTLKHLANAMSVGTNAIGEENLSDSLVAARLVRSILEQMEIGQHHNSTTSGCAHEHEDDISQTALRIVSGILRDLAEEMPTSTASIDQEGVSTLDVDSSILANQVIHDILYNLSHGISDNDVHGDEGTCSSNLASRIVRELLRQLESSVLFDNQRSDGCSAAASAIVMDMLRKLALNMCSESRSLHDMASSLVANTIVNEVLGQLTISTTAYTSQERQILLDSLTTQHTVNSILKQIARDIDENNLTDADIQVITTAIVSAYQVVDVQAIKSSQVQEFVGELLTNVVDELRAGHWTDSDLAHIGHLLDPDSTTANRNIAQAVKTTIESLQCLARAGQLSQAEIVAMAQSLVNSGTQIVGDIDETREDHGHSNTDMPMQRSTVLDNLKQKFSTDGFSANELKVVTTSILRTCCSSVTQGSELHRAQSTATQVMKTVNYLKKLAIDIQSGTVSPFIVSSLAYTIAKSVSGNVLPRAFSDVPCLELTSVLASHIRDILQEIMIQMAEDSSSLSVAEKVAAAVLDIDVANLDNEQPTDPETWTIISGLVDKILRDTAETLSNSIAKLTPSEALQLQFLCTTNQDNAEDYDGPWISKGSLKDLDSKLLESFVRGALEKVLQQTANVDSLDVSEKDGVEIKTSRTYSCNGNKEPPCISRAVVSIVHNTLQRIINSLEESKISEFEWATLSALAMKAHQATKETQFASPRSVDARTTKSILEAISHTYSDLGDVLFTPIVPTTDHVEVAVRRALAKLINDIDNQRIPLSRIETLRETLLGWWNGSKDNYNPSYKQLSVDNTDASNMTEGAVMSLVEKLKAESTLVGPVRAHESRSAIKITDSRVNSFVKNLETENPSLLRAASKHSVITSSSVVAEEIVQTIIRVLQDGSWTDAHHGSSETEISEVAANAVQSLMRQLQSDDISYSTSGIAQTAAKIIAQNIESEKESQSDMSVKLSVERVRSFVKNLEVNDPSLLKAISAHSASSTSLVAEELVQMLLSILQEESWKNKNVEAQTSKTSELALKAVQSVMKILVPSDVTLTVSELANEAVGIMLQRIKVDPALHYGESYSAERLNEKIIRSFVKNVEKEDPAIFQIASKHSSSSVAAEELVQTLITALKENKSEGTNITITMSNGTDASEIAILAVHSLIRCILSGETNIDGDKIEALVRKLEEDDPAILKVISEQSKATSTSVAVEEVVKAMLKFLEDESQQRILASFSNTSEIASKVVESVIQRLIADSSVSVANVDGIVKSAEYTVNSIVDIIQQDIQQTLAAPQSLPNKPPSSPATVRTPLGLDVNIDSVKTVLLKVIFDVSENRLSADLVEKIAAVSAGEMMKIFCTGKPEDTSQGIDDSKNDLCGSDSASASSKAAELAVIATLQSIVNDIDKGHFNLRELSAIFRAEQPVKPKSKTSPNVKTSLQRTPMSPPALNRDTRNGTPACTADTAVEELAELLSTITKSYSTLPKLTNSPFPVFSVADTGMATAGESTDRDIVSRESSRISTLIRETLARVLMDMKLNKLPLDSVCDIASCIVNTESEKFKEERIRSWVAQSRMFSEESHLIEAIASETIKNTLEKIRKGSLAASELRNIADDITQQMPDMSTSVNSTGQSDEQVQHFVIQTLEKILIDVQRVGLPNKPTQSLVNTVLEIAMNNEQASSETAVSICPNKVANLVSGVLRQITMKFNKVNDSNTQTTNQEQETRHITHIYIEPECNLNGSSSSGISIDETHEHHLKIVPTIDGQPLHLNSATTAAALSAISIRKGGYTINPHDVLARNSFRNLMRPELCRTEALSHDCAKILETKLIRVSQRNLSRFPTEEDVDMTPILEDSSSLTCSSSSAESTREDIDGKLKTVILLATDNDNSLNMSAVTDETATTDEPAAVSHNEISVKAKKTLSSGGTSTPGQNSKTSSKSVKPESKGSVNSNTGSRRSSTTVPKGKQSSTTAVSHSSATEMKRVRSNKTTVKPSVASLYSSPSIGKPPKHSKSSSRKSVCSLKRKSSETRKDKSRDAVNSQSKLSDSDKDAINVSDEPARVQSLCGSHTSSITVRSVGSAKTPAI